MLFNPAILNPLADALRSDRLAITDIPNSGGVLLDIAGQQVLSVNEVGMFLVHLIRREGGAAEPAQLVRDLLAEFEVDEATARADLDDFLADLARFLRIPC